MSRSGVRLSDLIPAAQVVVPLQSASVREAVGEMLSHLADHGAVREPDELHKALSDRRARDLVLIGTEVALPHYRTESVDRLIVALGIAPAPLKRAEPTLDPGPRILALILAPHQEATLYLQTVSALARLLRQEGVVGKLLEARSPEDVAQMPALAQTLVLPKLTVRDLMVHSDSVGPDMPVRDAVALMIRKRVRALPVLNEKREVLGIISEWDVMRGLLPQIPRAGTEDDPEHAAAQLKVRDIMTRSVLCVSEDLGIEEAASMMINKDVEQFPVVSEGKLTGFLSRSDIIRKLFGR